MGSSPGKNTGKFNDLCLKMCVIGDKSVGKTSLINRYIYNDFPATNYDQF